MPVGRGWLICKISVKSFRDKFVHLLVKLLVTCFSSFLLVFWFRLIFDFEFNAICNQFPLILPHNLNYLFFALLAHLFFSFFFIYFSFWFSFTNMIYSKFISKPVNFLPFALLQFFIIMSYHLHLFTLSHSQPPTSHLPLPLRLG